MTEKQLQTNVQSYLKRRNIPNYKFHSGGFSYGDTFYTTSSGVPDLLCCINGNFVGIEFKRDFAKLRDKQVIEMENITNNNGIYIVITPSIWIVFKNLMKEYKDILQVINIILSKWDPKLFIKKLK